MRWEIVAGRSTVRLRSLFRFCLRLLLVGGSQAPVIPAFPKQLDRMLCALGTIATTHGVRRTILVASPADALGVLGIQGKGLGHGGTQSVEVFLLTLDLARGAVKRIPVRNLSEVNSVQMGDRLYREREAPGAP